MICNYCGNEAEFMTSKEFYGQDYGVNMYVCRPCDAYVGTHGKGKTPLGTLANKRLRSMRKTAHSMFDPLWKGKYRKMGRSKAYQVMQKLKSNPKRFLSLSRVAILRNMRSGISSLALIKPLKSIAIKNWGKYNLNRGGKPILDCVKSELKEVKDTSLIRWVGEGISNDSVRIVYESYYDTSHDTYNDSSENEESSNDAGSYDTSTMRGQKEKQTEKQKQKENKKEKQTTDSEVGQSVGSSSDFARLVEFTNQNITPVLPTIAEHLGYILDDYKDIDLILAALQNAVLNNARNKIKYAEGTLINWRKDMITTYQQLQLKMKEVQRDARNSQNYERHSNEEYDGLSL